ncbi:DnaB-like helicase N-terminal domain-containing protein [Nodularia sp. UHCC 0506]|uniref:DnaB-like helicase N-terminal domain-containing protein n=1 Tax=Nodularia sp. UHCC 0506 TaxID=3110243 RepID=UPI002B204107|nr:DnaB-like helicase N-terminal domain-containing protein [Nodularia sp. UHCC 0506]MEA5516210.1 DnaB-like helicase N-terminal domain-containing protein [Nodularia sp. UHCC 0506]
MTQGIYNFPQSQFTPEPDDRLPPCNIEAEEAILGGILLDPNAIYRIKDRLKPEHFYISAHKDIYQACLRLTKQDKTTDLLSVTSWLTDHDILSRIGGRTKLASVVDRTVSAVNIEQLAALVMEKAMRRDLIKVAGEINRLGYETELEWPEISSLVADKTRSIIEIPIAPTKDEYQRWRHDRLLEQLTSIYTTCPEPSLRFLKLKDLADEHRVSMGFLETFYLKSLTAQCSKLLSYDELKALAGSTVREWLVNGLVPKSTTILLASDGGVGKTKFAYGLGKTIIQGKEFGQFQPTAEKRKILYYQGDESPGDMLQALESLGYSEGDINKYVKVRFGWSAENMPALIQDLSEFKPDFVVIDSLSTANRFSVYQESQMEYARPILEMTGLANQYNTTFVIIHHTNRDGGVRGTTAIRNAVSEVWQLSVDKSGMATPNDRILEINKSRSRSSGKKYRMIFNPDDLSFTFLGEEGEPYTPGGTAKDKTLKLLSDNRNIKFTSEEIAHRMGFSKDYARRYLTELSADGLVSVSRRPGKPNLYFLAYEGSVPGSPKDHPLDQYYSAPRNQADSAFIGSTAKCIKKLGSPLDTPQDHPNNPYTASDTAKGDPENAKNDLNFKKDHPSEKNEPKKESQDHLWLNPLPAKESGGDPGGDPTPDMYESIQIPETGIKDLPDNDSSSYPQGDPGGDPGVILSGGNSYKKVKNFTKVNIEVGGIYESRSLGKRVKVTRIYPSVKKADVLVAGDATAKPRLDFSDLSSATDAPNPKTNEEVKPGDWIQLTSNTNGLIAGECFEVVEISGNCVVVRVVARNNKQAGKHLGDKHIHRDYYKKVSKPRQN